MVAIWFQEAGSFHVWGQNFHPPRFAPNPNFVKRVRTHSHLRRGLHPFVFPLGFSFSAYPLAVEMTEVVRMNPRFEKEWRQLWSMLRVSKFCILCQWFRFCTFEFLTWIVILFGEDLATNGDATYRNRTHNLSISIYSVWRSSFYGLLVTRVDLVWSTRFDILNVSVWLVASFVLVK